MTPESSDDSATGDPRVMPQGSTPLKAAIVDDDPLMLNALARVLRGYEVCAFASAVDLLERVRAGERFDVIVSDMMMPVMTGAELFSELLRIAPEQGRRVIIVTGGATTSAASEFLATGVVPVVAKPFEPRELLGLIREVVGDLHGKPITPMPSPSTVVRPEEPPGASLAAGLPRWT